MKLDEFVKEALLEIIRGVDPAKREAGKTNPQRSSMGVRSPSSDHRVGPTRRGDVLNPELNQDVEFDVGVVVTEEVGGGGKGGVHLGVINVAGGGSSTTTETSTHRISFKVPVTFDGEPSAEENTD